MADLIDNVAQSCEFLLVLEFTALCPLQISPETRGERTPAMGRTRVPSWEAVANEAKSMPELCPQGPSLWAQLLSIKKAL